MVTKVIRFGVLQRGVVKEFVNEVAGFEERKRDLNVIGVSLIGQVRFVYVWERKVDFINNEEGWLIIWGVGSVFHDVGINMDCVLFSRNNLGNGLSRDVVS